ncbi:GIY-YIG nuclease family protein [Bordetella bronchiseptica]|uniref:GIY-YIG nuclease family protein n=1 Tax=Bordetella bronchiseptica TaxID=518 RepID=UPI0013F597BA|nr:GIY-YIG nuclease family protein [Bordetella bronchiseptica]
MTKDRRLTQSNLPSLAAEDQKNLRTGLAQRGVLVSFNKQVAPLENLISGAANCLYEFFHSNGYMIRRVEWDQRTVVSTLLNHVGWVYAFYGEDELPVYVGETGRGFQDRFTEHSRCAQWWPFWTGVKVLPCPDQSMRKVFESLIGLAGNYQANRMQPSGGDTIFDDVILSLLLLKNDAGEPPNFPNNMVRDNAEMLSDLLSNLN